MFGKWGMVSHMSKTRPRQVIGDAKRWKALTHPLRQEILRHLDEHEAANSTTIAEALDENTGTTSYHLRILADAGVIEEVPERAHGRERWWRTVRVNHREPEYDTLPPEDKAALDEWRALQIPGEIELFNRFIREFRKHGEWAKASRANAYFTEEDLRSFMDEYTELLNKYGYDRREAPEGARALQLRMFFLPEDPAAE
jgi:DNA-binding transcriptional ArsR family regulator